MSAPQVPGSPTAAPGEIVPPPAAPIVATPDLSPSWLPERLSRAEEQARAKLLQDLGVTDLEKGKAAIAAAAKAEEEAKSTGQKLGETAKERDTFKSEAERLRVVTAEWAGRQMMGLTAEQQAAVKAIAGDDAAAQLKAITALTPTWGKAAPLPGSAPVAPPAAPPTPATGTAPPPTAPGSTTISQQSPREVHAALAKNNPFAAAEFAMANLREVYPDPK
jgi:hypothetical protein